MAPIKLGDSGPSYDPDDILQHPIYGTLLPEGDAGRRLAKPANPGVLQSKVYAEIARVLLPGSRVLPTELTGERTRDIAGRVQQLDPQNPTDAVVIASLSHVPERFTMPEFIPGDVVDDSYAAAFDPDSAVSTRTAFPNRELRPEERVVNGRMRDFFIQLHEYDGFNRLNYRNSELVVGQRTFNLEVVLSELYSAGSTSFTEGLDRIPAVVRTREAARIAATINPFEVFSTLMHNLPASINRRELIGASHTFIISLWGNRGRAALEVYGLLNPGYLNAVSSSTELSPQQPEPPRRGVAEIPAVQAQPTTMAEPTPAPPPVIESREQYRTELLPVAIGSAGRMRALQPGEQGPRYPDYAIVKSPNGVFCINGGRGAVYQLEQIAKLSVLDNPSIVDATSFEAAITDLLAELPTHLQTAENGFASFVTIRQIVNLDGTHQVCIAQIGNMRVHKMIVNNGRLTLERVGADHSTFENDPNRRLIEIAIDESDQSIDTYMRAIGKQEEAVATILSLHRRFSPQMTETQIKDWERTNPTVGKYLRYWFERDDISRYAGVREVPAMFRTKRVATPRPAEITVLDWNKNHDQGFIVETNGTRYNPNDQRERIARAERAANLDDPTKRCQKTAQHLLAHASDKVDSLVAVIEIEPPKKTRKP